MSLDGFTIYVLSRALRMFYSSFPLNIFFYNTGYLFLLGK